MSRSLLFQFFLRSLLLLFFFLILLGTITIMSIFLKVWPMNLGIIFTGAIYFILNKPLNCYFFGIQAYIKIYIYLYLCICINLLLDVVHNFSFSLYHTCHRLCSQRSNFRVMIKSILTLFFNFCSWLHYFLIRNHFVFVFILLFACLLFLT